jgi:hypothetical protein
MKKLAKSSNLGGEVSQTEESSPDTSVPDFVKVEKNLASLGFFTPPKREIKKARSKMIRFSRLMGESRVEAEVKISADEELGLPTTADQDKYLAFQKMVRDKIAQDGEVRNPISFQSADILNLLGLADSGENFKEVERWLDRMTTTTIISKGAVYFAGKKRWATDRFLVPLLQIWLYASREAGVFEKRYDELCQILHLTQYKHASKIKEKIGPALDELKHHRYISDWNLVPSSDPNSFKVVFTHGEKFYADRQKRIGLSAGEDDGDLASLANQIVVSASELISDATQGGDPLMDSRLTKSEESLVERLHTEFGVGRRKAAELVAQNPDGVRRQVEAWAFREKKPKNPAGWIIRAIEGNFELPSGFVDAQQKEESKKRKLTRAEAIAACPYCCHSEGYRFTARGARPCTHDPAREEVDPFLI